jgi:hypothetical protein
MARMTEEEAWALSDHFTNNEYTLGPDGSDWLSQREIRISGLKNMTVQYLLTKAKAANKSPVQIIDELVGKEIAAAI